MKQFKLNTCGQVFSTDLIIASLVFLLLLTTSIIYSNDIANRVSLAEKDNERDSAAILAANALLYSQGTPANWENQPDLLQAKAIGIAKTRNEIDSAKLQKMTVLSQTEFGLAKDLLGLGGYLLKVTVLDMQNGQILSEFGAGPPEQKSTSTVNRIALLDTKKVIVRVQVFEQ